MKIFVLSKDTIIIYGLVILVLVGMFTVGSMSETVLTNANESKQIPIYSVERNDNKIALTFDAAWGNEDVDELIRIMAENNIKAGFFVVGGFVDRYPESIKKLKDAGHEILNHSDTHLHMSKLSKEQVIKELSGCEDKIKNITGESTKIFRFPYGDYSENAVKWAMEAGYIPIQWDVDSLDWKDITPEEIKKRVVKGVKKGSIILCHSGAKNTPAALGDIIRELKNKGFEFAPVSELIYKENYVIDNSGRQLKY